MGKPKFNIRSSEFSVVSRWYGDTYLFIFASFCPRSRFVFGFYCSCWTLIISISTQLRSEYDNCCDRSYLNLSTESLTFTSTQLVLVTQFYSGHFRCAASPRHTYCVLTPGKVRFCSRSSIPALLGCGPTRSCQIFFLPG